MKIVQYVSDNIKLDIGRIGKMNNLNDLVFNSETGLFENRNDPTAHLSLSGASSSET